MESMIHAIMSATLVSKCVLVLLVCMSIGSWAFMGRKWLQLRRVMKDNENATILFDQQSSLDDALVSLKPFKNSSYTPVVNKAVKEFNRLNKTGDAERLMQHNVRRSISHGISEEMTGLSSSLSLLATTANTAPFIGLFGTVWGIMYSFHAIALMKSVSLATVAPGIAEALIATAVGLFVAIPATFGYNMFRSYLSHIQKQSINFAGMLLNRIEHEVAIHPDGIKDPLQEA